MNKKFIILTLIFAVIHFVMSIASIYNGFIIFRSPSTPTEIFWARAMSVMLFPANIISQGSANELIQTLIILFNSLFCGALIAFMYLVFQKILKK